MISPRSLNVLLVTALVVACTEVPQEHLLAPPSRVTADVISPIHQSALTVTSPASIAGPVTPLGVAVFGPAEYDVSGQLVYVGNACSPLPPAPFEGAIALVDRGTCTFANKTQNAQNAGYAGVIIVDNTTNTIPPNMAGTAPGIVIPTVSVTQAEGQSLKSALAAGPVFVHLVGTFVDTQAPVVTVPANTVINATSPSGAVFSYTASAADNSGPVSVVCVPPSGSLFVIGTTTVTCTSTDASGNVGTASFLVTVLGAAAQIDNLESAVAGLSLDQGVANSLLVKLQGAQNALSSGNTNAVCGKLGAFANELAAVSARMSPPDTSALTEDINRIIAVAGCS